MAAVSAALFCAVAASQANEPVASYVFPAGGQRGTTVNARVGGLFLHGEAGFEMRGAGVKAQESIKEIETRWFEGPVIPLPASQKAEDYPKDHAASIEISADAPLGAKQWRLSTSQGVTSAKQFIVGDLPEIVEEEIDGDPLPVKVTLPVTINGRTFPREDVDAWIVELSAGQTVHCEVNASRLGSPLDSRLEALDPRGRRLAENNDAYGADSFLRFTAVESGPHQIRLHDIGFDGLQDFVYRLTLTSGPKLDANYPLGGKRGAVSEFALMGHGLRSTKVKIALPTSEGVLASVPFDVAAGVVQHAFVELDDLPEFLESEPNETGQAGEPLTVPAVVNGQIERAGDVDGWRFVATKGQALALIVRAARLGSPLDGVLTIHDAAGKELAKGDDSPGDQSDPMLVFTPPTDGTYLAIVSERFVARGGPSFAYRLKIAPQNGLDFRLLLPTDALNVPRGGQANLKLALERQGYDGPIDLEFVGLPASVTPSLKAIPANQNNATIEFKAAADAKASVTTIQIVGRAKLAEQDVARSALLGNASRGDVPQDQLALAVTLPTPFKIVGTFYSNYAPRGSVYRRHYVIERGGYDGPLEVSLADRQARHLQGVRGPLITVPAGASEFDYPASLSPWLEIGRTSRTCVMAVGEVVDIDGSKHRVSFSSVNQNEQIVILTDPNKLSIQPERSSLRVNRGEQATIDVRIDRHRTLASSPVTLELVLPAHITGVHAESVTILPRQTRGTLTIRFDHACGPFNMPLAIRGTARDDGDPVVAEGKVDLVDVIRDR